MIAKKVTGCRAFANSHTLLSIRASPPIRKKDKATSAGPQDKTRPPLHRIKNLRCAAQPWGDTPHAELITNSINTSSCEYISLLSLQPTASLVAYSRALSIFIRRFPRLVTFISIWQFPKSAEFHQFSAANSSPVTVWILSTALHLSVDPALCIPSPLGSSLVTCVSVNFRIFLSGKLSRFVFMISVHKELTMVFPNLVTILVTRHPHNGQHLAKALQKSGMHVALRSKNEMVSPSVKFYVVDTLGELGKFYKATPIAVIGGSFQSGLAGHNLSEAAAAGCAVLTGPHLGHFSRMLSEMKQVDPLSVMQVERKVELVEVLKQLLSNPELLEARQKAAKLAFSAVSKGVVENVWRLLYAHLLMSKL